MAKKKQEIRKEPEKSLAEYYKLKTKAVDDLVNATEENAPPVSKQELRRYQSAPSGIKMAEWVKAVLIKTWMAGIVCYFFIWGIGMYVSDQLDLLAITAVALGFVTDILTNNIFRFIAKPENANDRWMMIPPKKFISLPLNVLYAFVLVFCVVQTYNAVNAVIAAMTHGSGTAALGVGPILFGLFAMGWDMLFIGAKRLFKRILADAKSSARSS
ncbi:MAG: hypothetical protein IJQ33_08765 [Clostridia bacterium]|nr:hypothetical protein [Clostridia bacterium]